MPRQLGGLPLQLGEVVEGVGAAQFAGMNQAHEQVTELHDRLPLRCARVRRPDASPPPLLQLSAGSGCPRCPLAPARPWSSRSVHGTTVGAVPAASLHGFPATGSRSSGCGSRLSVSDSPPHPALPAPPSSNASNSSGVTSRGGAAGCIRPPGVTHEIVASGDSPVPL